MIFFLDRHVEDGLNFRQANFGVNKIAKIIVRPANLLFNLKNPNPCTVN